MRALMRLRLLCCVVLFLAGQAAHARGFGGASVVVGGGGGAANVVAGGSGAIAVSPSGGSLAVDCNPATSSRAGCLTLADPAFTAAAATEAARATASEATLASAAAAAAATANAAIPTTQKAVASGVGTLDVTGHQPTGQLASVVVTSLNGQQAGNGALNIPPSAFGAPSTAQFAQAISGVAPITGLTGGTHVLAVTEYANAIITAASAPGGLTAAQTFTTPAAWQGFVVNLTGGPFGLSAGPAGGTGCAVPQGGVALVVSDGTNGRCAGVPVGGDASSNTVIATGGTSQRRLADIGAQMVNVLDYAGGVAINARQTASDASMAAGSNTIFSPTANFPSTICPAPGNGCSGNGVTTGNTIISMTGSGAPAYGMNGSTQTGTVTGWTDAQHITVSFSATQAVPHSAAVAPAIVVEQSGSGSYVPGEIVTDASGLGVVPASYRVMDTSAIGFAAVSFGAGGGAGATCILHGTTGTIQAHNTVFTINATLGSDGTLNPSTGAVLGPAINNGGYTANPVNLAAEPVTATPQVVAAPGCTGLTGATLSMKMGADYLLTVNAGKYLGVSTPGGVLATTSNLAGTGLMMQLGGVSQTGGVIKWGPDASPALAAAVTKANSLYTSLSPKEVYLPQGGYMLRNTAIPPLLGNVRLHGDGYFQSVIDLDPAWVGTALVSCSNSWNGQNNALGLISPTVPEGQLTSGCGADNLGVVGDRTAAHRMDGFDFLDRNDRIDLRNIAVYDIPGSTFCLGCGVTITGGRSYTRESQIGGLMDFSSGLAAGDPRSTDPQGVACTEIETLVAGHTNDIRLSQFDGFGCYGPPFRARATGTGVVLDLHINEMRVERQSNLGTPQSGDNVVLGDSSGSYCGLVEDINIDMLQDVDPLAGYAAFRTTACPGVSGSAPFGIVVDKGIIKGGDPYGDGIVIGAAGKPFGDGVNLVAGGQIKLDFLSIRALGTDFIVGNSALVNDGIKLLLPHGTTTTGLTTNIDPTSAGYVTIGDPSVVAPSDGSILVTNTYGAYGVDCAIATVTQLGCSINPASWSGGTFTGLLKTTGGLTIASGNETIPSGSSLIMAGIASSLLATNPGGNVGAVINSTMSAGLDLFGSAQGDVLFRGASGWVALTPGTAGQVLTSGGASANPTWAAGSTGGLTSINGITTPAAIIEQCANYTASATITRPSWATWVYGFLIGSGGPGGAGVQATAGTAYSGGGSGGAGRRVQFEASASSFGASAALAINAGSTTILPLSGYNLVAYQGGSGSAGAAATASAGGGSASAFAAGGAASGATAGNGGAGGGDAGASGVTTGVFPIAVYEGSGGVGSSATGAAGVNSAGADQAPTGGGSGAGMAATQALLTGGNAGLVGKGGADSSGGTTAGQAGATGAVYQGFLGGGGGGGANNTAGAGGAGGTGGLGGGGGGGGDGSTGGGAGGAGGAGFARVCFKATS